MLTKKELSDLRNEMVMARKPMIFFDDDTDGLCSFLILYRFMKQYIDDMKGTVCGGGPILKEDIHSRKIEEFNPDKIFILDKALVAQEFIDRAHRPVVWLDHHPLLQRSGVKYFNPLKHPSKKYPHDNRPTSYWAFKAVEKDRPNDMWISMAGSIADWFVPEFAKKFSLKYPDLLPKGMKIKNPGQVLFETRLGTLCRILDFNMKGQIKDVMTSFKILTRIDDPYEIIDQKTPPGKFIYKRYAQLNKVYEEVKSRVKIGKDPLVLFEYEDNYSLTANLSTEIQYFNPEKFVLICRFKDGSMKCSLRSEKYHVRNILERALVGVEGYGGGHDHACGASVKKEDFEKFVDNIRKEIGKES